MKLAITGEHRRYFEKYSVLELEDLLSTAQSAKLCDIIAGVIVDKSNTNKIRWQQVPAHQAFKVGHDLWRDNSDIAKWAQNAHFAEIAAELFHQRILRLGSDQWLEGLPVEKGNLSSPATQEAQAVYAQLLEKSLPLNAYSCLQGACGGLMLCLEGAHELTEELYMGVFPAKTGSGIYFPAHHPIDFATLKERAGQKFWLIVYAEKTSIYTRESEDPHVHSLKHLGYVFGDRLSDRLNPIVYRK